MLGYAWSVLRCRVCSSATEPVVSLGELPPCGVFVQPETDAETERYPLDLHFCPTCGLSQLGERVSPREYFRRNAHLASHSPATQDHHVHLAEELARQKDKGCIVDIGCNDGMLLSCLAKRGYDVLGIDPSIPASKITTARGIPIVTEFFEPDVVEKYNLCEKADIVCCTNTLQHVDDLHKCMDAVSMMLKKNGWFVIEVGHVASVLKEFHQIHHEYITYFWSKPLCILAGLHGFSIQRMEMLPIHGGVLRAWLRKSSDPHCDALPEEKGLGSADTYRAFAESVPHTIHAIRECMATYTSDTNRMVGYGASARGLILAHVCGLGDFLDACVDTAPTKIGKVIPGLNIPVISEEEWMASGIRYSVILPTHLEREIILRTGQYQKQGGRFLRLLPHPGIVSIARKRTRRPALQSQ